MLINEIFSSIDGEGIRTGYPVTFIRSYGCNLLCSYCFGIKPGRHIPQVHLVHPLKEKRVGANGVVRNTGGRIPINMVKVGDELFTYDENMNVVTTTVTNILDREVTEWYEIKIGNTEYYVTPEHPIFTTNGMKQAQDLHVGDVVLHTDNSMLSSIRMTINNPMKNVEISNKVHSGLDYKKIGQKIKNTITEKQKTGVYQSPWQLLSQQQRDEVCKKISQSKLRENNPNWVDNYPYRNYQDLKNAINKNPEQFKCERCGISGTQKGLHVHHIDGTHENDNMDNLAVLCCQCHNQIHQRGYNFWTDNRVDGKKCLAAVCNANGMEVTKVKHVNITQHKHYGRDYGPKTLHVYNISCAPYNTYFMDTIWVHNCDTLYAVDPQTEEDKQNAFVSMTPEEILNKCIELNLNKITFTGGEPLIQKDAPELVALLLSNDFEVNIETNGAVNIEEFNNKLVEVLANDELLNNLIYTMDYKCPSSGMEDKMIMENIDYLNDVDVLKFVVGTQEDLDKMKSILDEYTPECNIFVSPVFEQMDPKNIVQFILDNNMQNVRVQIQLHKLIWEPSTRGV